MEMSKRVQIDHATGERQIVIKPEKRHLFSLFLFFFNLSGKTLNWNNLKMALFPYSSEKNIKKGNSWSGWSFRESEPLRRWRGNLYGRGLLMMPSNSVYQKSNQDKWSRNVINVYFSQGDYSIDVKSQMNKDVVKKKRQKAGYTVKPWCFHVEYSEVLWRIALFRRAGMPCGILLMVYF